MSFSILMPYCIYCSPPAAEFDILHHAPCRLRPFLLKLFVFYHIYVINQAYEVDSCD